MPATKIDDDKLILALTAVFQTYGYEGASLSRIAKATGLGRASLYHRFPGGKVDMAQAVLRAVDVRFSEHVLSPLAGNGAPDARVREMAKRTAEFFFGGERSCVLDTLSVGQEEPSLCSCVENSLVAWRDAMAAVAREAGIAGREAQRRGEDALIRIQGALVLARGTQDRRAFKRVMRELPDQLTRVESL